MGKTAYDVYRYSYVVVLAFGILGNILVIISILRQKRLLKNNYYYVVLHLAICDLTAPIFYFLSLIDSLVDEHLDTYSKSCVFFGMADIFAGTGICMMLIISLLRYRAVVHPLKPAISQRKLKVVCGLAYIVGCITGYGTDLPLCFMERDDVAIVYRKVRFGYVVSCAFFSPTIFMAAVYYKIGRALIKQNKHMKSICSNPVRQSAPNPSFNILKFIRNRRTFFVCICTVLCYGVGNIPFSLWYMWYIAGKYELQMKNFWLWYLAVVLRVAGSHSINPLIYGILDKNLLIFWKLCRKKKRRPNEN